ncbi:putative DnaQ-like exonuclease [Pseudomonas phage UF_RH7]|nr:putative DnaQ-like exonuclease [Pseudomonas phage UF_RH7]
MLDCESLSTKANAALLSISAVAFDLSAGNRHDLIISTFDSHILIDSAFSGGHVDPQTVLWWMRQGDASRLHITHHQRNAVPEIEALLALTAWIERLSAKHGVDSSQVEVWSNDELADALWLANAYARHDLGTPWPWWGHRCFRTLNSLFPGFRSNTPFDGTPHIGIDDARHQAVVLWRIVREGMRGCTHLNLGDEA